MNSQRQPQDSIALFDSGVGGLTVLRALKKQMPFESFIYLGDTARLPYGSKSPETVSRYVEQNLQFLARFPIKAVVIACNTASAAFIQHKTDFLKKHALPVFNVIEPAAELAIKSSAGRPGEARRIGILATRATIESGVYVRAVQELNGDCYVVSQACPLLVPLVEEGWEDDPITNLIVYRYLGPILAQNVDTLILGCTHYPALKTSLLKAAGPGINLIQSADALAPLIVKNLEQDGLLVQGPTAGKIKIMVTDASLAFQNVAERLLGEKLTIPLEHIDVFNP